MPDLKLRAYYQEINESTRYGYFELFIKDGICSNQILESQILGNW
jgi:hypothetical protein